MRLISLNTWGGRAGKETILDFFRRHADVDIFCLQEVWNGGHEEAGKWLAGASLAPIPTLLADIENVLRDHRAFFRPHYMDWWGLALFVRNDVELIEEGDIFVFKEKGDVFESEAVNHARNMQYATIEFAEGARTVLNLHGVWNGGGKEDSTERLLQSDNIGRFLGQIPNPYVLCGDFNLLPHTESLKKLERLGMRNLIKEFGITSTRTRLYQTSPHQFADYIFVSQGVVVNNFKVLPDEVSDHSPLYLDFN